MDDFYRAFEDRHRGSRELIKDRLAVYLPFVKPLLQNYPNAEALDLGCGRGEWLEVISNAGFKARGVDLDAGMLSACHERNLCVENQDALTALRTAPNSSLAVISAFHVVEHINFDDVRALIAESMRALVPGGLMILETPNPENIVVAGCNFFLDPTHQRPIPPQLLSFAVEHAGFERTKVLRLQEAASLCDEKYPLNLISVLEGVSPDYAVIGQKGGSQEIIEASSEVFARDFGLNLQTLANRFSQQAEDKAQHAEAKAQHAEAKAQQAEDKAQHAEAKAQQAEDKAQHAEAKAQQAEDKAQHAEAKAQQAEAKARQAEAASTQALMQLQAVYTSTSWRITAPLRGLAGQAFKLSPQRLKPQIKLLLRHAALYVYRRPRLRNTAFAVLNRFPTLKRRLVSLITNTPVPATVQQNAPAELAHLTPRARQIYADLKQEIEEQKGRN